MSGVAITERAERAERAAPHTVDDVILDEQEMLLIELLAEGLVLDAIARRLDLSERTVRRRIRALCDRMHVATPVQVVVRAVRAGVV
jgi:DNA-binding NarL/FixJ family response regulator